MYGFVGNKPISFIDAFGMWSETGEALWGALKYVVPGSEFPEAALSAPDAAKALILTAFKNACLKCLKDPPSCGSCDICDDYAKVASKLGK